MKPLTRQEREDRRDERKAALSNADIRPFVSAGEAAELVLSKLVRPPPNART